MKFPASNNPEQKAKELTIVKSRFGIETVNK